jgi:beta-glucosidase
VIDRLLPDWQRLSLARQVAQLFVVRTSGHLFDHQLRYPQWEAEAATLRHYVEDLGVGGVIWLGGHVAELSLRCRQVQDWASLPLLMAADIEEGVGQRFGGAVWLPPPMALGEIARQDLELAIGYARRMGSTTAQEARAVGLNWLLAPIVDVNNNPANPVINIRALGDDPAIVAALAVAFIAGAHEHPVLTSAKHFPGHGDTATDSHLDLPVITHDRDRLDAVELMPFKRAIAAGVSSVMTAHLILRQLDADRPATLSSKILTDLLRNEWSYDGLIVTDALVMDAISQRYGANEAPLLAFEAGADILLMPVDAPGAIDRIVEAIEAERLDHGFDPGADSDENSDKNLGPLETRLHQSLERIWQAKLRIAIGPDPGSGGCPAWDAEPPVIDIKALALPEAFALGEAILSRSMRRSGPDLAPNLIPGLTQPETWIVVDNLIDAPYLAMHSPAIVLPRAQGYTPRWLDLQTPLPQASGPVLLQLFIRGNPFRNSAGMLDLAKAIVTQLLAQDQLAALVLYGSPYIWDELQTLIPDSIPSRFCYGQMPQAQQLVLTELLSDRPSSTHRDAFTD